MLRMLTGRQAQVPKGLLLWNLRTVFYDKPPTLSISETLMQKRPEIENIDEKLDLAAKLSLIKIEDREQAKKDF